MILSDFYALLYLKLVEWIHKIFIQQWKKSFKIEDDRVFIKYNDIWNKTFKILFIKFHSQPAYDEKYIKANVKTFNGVVNTVFSDDKVSKETIHYICITAINIDSVMRIDKKPFPKFIQKK